ncbi:MAG: hypothetical protein JWM95_3891 [Gemmatimonadetes bacterium]|nr:hypothetical protein [Gemmatimonadota bacterium]
MNAFAITSVRANFAVSISHEAIFETHRVLKDRIKARFIVLEKGVVEHKADLLSVFHHPMECLVRQAVWITAATDVAVDAGEPGLLKCSAPPRRPSPDAWQERLAAFIYRHGVVCILD